MQSLFLSTVFFSLMLLGVATPFAAALGFVWVDLVKPQQLAYSLIRDWPLSFIAASAALSLFFIKDRKEPPKFRGILVLIAMLAAWITITSMLSTIPQLAWLKWDPAFKVLVFAIFIPYAFRSRVQIEALLLVIIFSTSTIFFSAGVKTVLGGGGYSTLAIIGSGNTGLSESSTLAAVCVMLIPLIIFVMRHSVIFPKNLATKLLFIGVIATALSTVVGTGARTGLIAVGVLCIQALLRSKKKMLWIALFVVAGVAFKTVDLSGTQWGSRMSTIEGYDKDSSALGRIAVWKWTLEYVGQHPLGGGFNAYVLNRIHTVSGDGVIDYYEPGELAGKAFHSIYFEVLGEQGIVGFAIYFSTILLALLKLRALRKKYAGASGMEWVHDLADGLTSSILVFLAGGLFVGIAHQPFVFYLLGLCVALDQYARRVELNTDLEKTGRMTA